VPSPPPASGTAAPPVARPLRPREAPPADVPRHTNDRLWRAAPALVAALGALAYLLVEPRTVDLAAHVYRAGLFDREGFTIWNNEWYSGHYTLSHSVLYPPLASWLGPRTLGAVAAVVSAAAFEPLVRAHFGERARWGALWFGIGALTPLYAGRLPFGVGVALGLAAALALQRRRTWPAAALAAAAALSSPVAGVFLALAGAALFLTRDRLRGLALATGGLVPPVAVSLVFGNAGREPFEFSAWFPLPVMALAFAWALPRGERTLRVGALVYALASVAWFAIETPMGGNGVRLGALVGGPVLLCALLARDGASWLRPRGRLGRLRPVAIVVLLAGLAFWQWSPAVRDLIKGLEDPSVESAYYEPLLRFLDRAGGPPGRVEIPFTRSHWEAAEVAPHHPLARGWLRQTDTDRNRIFYDGALNRVTYGAWLAERGVRWVALPSAKPDYSAYHERALIESGLPYLRLRFRSEDWRVYEVTLPHPLVVSKAPADVRLERLGSDEAVLDVRRAGEAVVRVHWNPYWRLEGGCVERAGEWTRIAMDRPGRVRLVTTFDPGRVVSRGRRCSDGS